MLQNLAEFDSGELQAFLDSFDNVFCDCDGVIWHLGTLISGVDESVSKLKEFGKEVRFVTNNSYLGLNSFCARLKQLKVPAEPDDVANPCLAIINHLKHIKYTRSICVLGSTYFKQEIKDAGFDVVELDVPSEVDDEIQQVSLVIKDMSKNVEKVGAVIFDIDLNLNYLKLSAILMCLQNPDVLFLTACSDKTFPLGPKMLAIGPHYFIKPMKDITGREPITFGKPSMKANEFLVDKFKINNPSRTLFIGDSLDNDIEFASKCGYHTLLVLTGNAKLEDAKNTTNRAQIPDFYLNSLGDLHELIKKKLAL